MLLFPYPTGSYDMNTIVTSKTLKPFTKTDEVLDQFISHAHVMQQLSHAQIERDKQDRKLMDYGICPHCKNTDTDEIHVPGEFPGQGYFKFRCNTKGCGFVSGE